MPAASTSRAELLDLSTSSWGPGDPVFMGEIKGSVRLSTDGCVFAHSRDGGDVDLVWPRGYTASRIDDAVTIRNAQGESVAEVGTLIDVAGGEGDAQNLACRVNTNQPPDLIMEDLPVLG